jgi:inorganic phosphate transporter, PiT family
VSWKVANNIVVAWIVTIPASAFIGAVFYAAAGLLG